MSVYNLMMKRRSVRVFLDKTIPEEIVEKLLDVANNAPSGGNIQPISIITVRNTETRNKLYELIPSQPWVKNAPLSLIFCLDFNRVKRWAELSNVNFEGEKALSHFLIAYADIMCAAQNVVITAESYGLGSVYIGTIQAFIGKFRDYFAIPKYVLPLMLLSIGYPESIPESMPKLKQDIIVHNEKYETLDDQDIIQAYYEKYGDFDEDINKYLKKAYIEVLEASKQQAGNWMELVKKRMKKLKIENHAQFLFKLRYPSKAMVKSNKPQIEELRNAGFDFF